MINKPFKLPSIRRPDATALVSSSPAADSGHVGLAPPAKKRRIDVHHDESSDAEQRYVAHDTVLNYDKPISSDKQHGFRTPLVTVKNVPSPESTQHGREGEGVLRDNEDTIWYNVLWRKPTTKKHKTWDGDGYLSIGNGIATLRDAASGKEFGKIPLDRPLLIGSMLAMAGREIEVHEILRGKPTPTPHDKGGERKAVKAIQTGDSEPRRPLTAQHPALNVGKSLHEVVGRRKVEHVKTSSNQITRDLPPQNAFKNPLKDVGHLPQVQRGPAPVPRHDPNAPGALVMKQPKSVPVGKQIVDVVLDPLLSKHLRDHQREGVKFLYECVMGLRDFSGEGAILADEMGLGKTLQTIALLWTLLKQNPIHGNPPVVKKALIVCPVTLINNWRKEFRKWLGNERIGVFVADGKKTRLTNFTLGKSYSVMIIGYERLRQVAEDLTKGSGIDIVIADEGHRLKTVQNKSAQAIQSLNTSRRVILSGTPIQNDLSEFFSMVNFVNDGLLGTYKQFVKQFENPMVRSRQPNALHEHIEQGQDCSEELARLTSPFILRRTADILSKYLPPKTEYVLFCDPLPAQAYVYRNVISSPIFQSIGNAENALQLITILKKLCNSPFLLSPRYATDTEAGNSSKLLNDLLEVLPPSLHRSLSNQASTKLRTLDQLLDAIRKNTSEKVVLVSNYTSSLDLLAGLLSSNGLPFLRLDGSTPAAKRQSIVDDFNRSSHAACFAFLLSAKAGGVGLNLIGASRLILFDVDWNPATDLQAMARIHREGQKRPCRIYRFVLKGSVEERIWQRQVTKLGLADSVMEMGAGGSGKANAVAQFSREELRDLFRLDGSSDLRTHALLNCACGGHGRTPGDVVQDGEDEFIDIDSLDRVQGAITPDLDVSGATSVMADNNDENDGLPILPKFTKASQCLIENGDGQPSSSRQSPQARTTQKEKEEAIQRASLMLYQHINVSELSATELSNNGGTSEEAEAKERIDECIEEIIGDEILQEVLQTEGNNISWVFRKTSEHARVLSKPTMTATSEESKKDVSSFFK